jgi:type I restriction enzyme, S subunit
VSASASTRIAALGEIAEIDRHGIDPSSIVTGTLFVGLENITGAGGFDGVRPVDAGELASTKFKFSPKHILYGKLRPYLRKIARPQFSGICSTDILPILPGPEVDRSYLAHFLRTDSMVRLAESRSSGANLPRLSPSALAEFEIPLPPLDEQRRIAAILDKAEALRAKRRETFAKLSDLKESIFLETFGDPATNSRSLPLVALGELFSESPCYGSMIPPQEQGHWTSLRVGNIQDWKLDLTDEKFIDLPANAVRRFSLQDGDMVLARAIASQDHLGKCIVVYPKGRRWAFDSHLMRLRFNLNRILPEYLSAMFRTSGGRSLFLSVTRRSAVQFNVNTKEMAALRIPLAPIELQRRFLAEMTLAQQSELRQQNSASGMNNLFLAFQHRAFRGEL